MSFFFLLFWFLLQTDGTPMRAAQPAPDTAPAYALLEEDRTEEALARFLALIRSGSRDPWAFRGAALCATGDEAAANALLEILAEHPRPALAHFARGYLLYRLDRFGPAENELRKALVGEPEMALAWKTLGAVLRARGRAVDALPAIERALLLAPGLDMAWNNLQAAHLKAGVFHRLKDDMLELARTWQQLPPPLIPSSGCTIEQVLAETEREDIRAAVALVGALSRLAQPARDRLHFQILAERGMSEADFWVAAYLAQNEIIKDPVEAALTVEVMLTWSALTGRRDFLFFAAAQAVDLVLNRLGVEPGLQVSKPWSNVPAEPGSERSQGLFLNSHATLLFHAGENQGALDAYRRARLLFAAVGDQLGEGNTWLGEADVLFRLGENQGALDAYLQARALYQKVGDQQGEGNTLLGEARVHRRLGEPAFAAAAAQKAASLYQAVGHIYLRYRALLVEARARFALGQAEPARSLAESALALHRQWRDNFITDEQRISQDETIAGVYDILVPVLAEQGDFLLALPAPRRPAPGFCSTCWPAAP